MRECAEAQGKDFGIIATENGWNLYVCGNGGAKPRHADLLAADLDEDTLIKYIDRFLMFYIRTADRLQRTCAWLEAVDGGIEHLKASRRRRRPGHRRRPRLGNGGACRCLLRRVGRHPGRP